MLLRLAFAALTTSACLAADPPFQVIGNQGGGSLLLQLRPPVGFHHETLSITATIRGAEAEKHHLATGVPTHFRYSDQEDSLVLLVCARDAHGLLGEPIAILEQARTNPPPTRPRHAIIPLPPHGHTNGATTAADADDQWFYEACCDLVTRCALDVELPLLV